MPIYDWNDARRQPGELPGPPGISVVHDAKNRKIGSRVCRVDTDTGEVWAYRRDAAGGFVIDPATGTISVDVLQFTPPLTILPQEVFT